MYRIQYTTHQRCDVHSYYTPLNPYANYHTTHIHLIYTQHYTVHTVHTSTTHKRADTGNRIKTISIVEVRVET